MDHVLTVRPPRAPSELSPPEGLPELAVLEDMGAKVREALDRHQPDRPWVAYYGARSEPAWYPFHVSADGEDLVSKARAYLAAGGHYFRHAFILAPTGQVVVLLRLDSGKPWPVPSA